MQSPNQRHLKIVNASGFPFQIAVADVVEACPESLWEVSVRERAWRHPKTGHSGFIDLVLSRRQNSVERMVMECKRQGGDPVGWYFLDPKPATTELLAISCQRNPRTVPHVHGATAFPESVVSEFCVIPGQGSADKPILERLAFELIEACEALAMDELVTNDIPTFRKTYLPVLVTNVNLYLCKFSPASVSLTAGTLPDHTEFVTVPFVRFRKSLWAETAGAAEGGLSLFRLHERSLREVFVVSSTGLQEFLQKARLF